MRTIEPRGTPPPSAPQMLGTTPAFADTADVSARADASAPPTAAPDTPSVPAVSRHPGPRGDSVFLRSLLLLAVAVSVGLAARLLGLPWWAAGAVAIVAAVIIALVFVLTSGRGRTDADPLPPAFHGPPPAPRGAAGAPSPGDGAERPADQAAPPRSRDGSSVLVLERQREELAASEARLRLLFDSAVDGIVELDAEGAVVRANDAFLRLVRLSDEEVVGRGWSDVALAAPGGGPSLAALPDSGEGTVTGPDGSEVFLECRSSEVPTTPPGRLLLIRDATATRTGERTIRTLFQFLQDRDEDRTQLLKRTSAAVESERNRIARDLHDGPIQGVTAASLSLQAVRLMLEAGDVERAREMLAKIRTELTEETNNLRRVMSDLRPPLLEERGLVPAIRELSERFERETRVDVTFVAGQYVNVPPEVETLGYRVAQEALTNVSRHAEAHHVLVRVETSAGRLLVEVEDDGVGFDPAEEREFVRMGRVGLASMRERAELGGGTLVVRSRRGAGTTVSLSVPFDVLAAAAATLAPQD